MATLTAEEYLKVKFGYSKEQELPKSLRGMAQFAEEYHLNKTKGNI